MANKFSKTVQDHLNCIQHASPLCRLTPLSEIIVESGGEDIPRQIREQMDGILSPFFGFITAIETQSLFDSKAGNVVCLKYMRRYANDNGAVTVTLHASFYAFHQESTDSDNGQKSRRNVYWTLPKHLKFALDDEPFMPETGDELTWFSRDDPERVILTETLSEEGEDVYVRFETELINLVVGGRSKNPFD